MDRPFRIALGWPVPAWILDYGPAGFVALFGLGWLAHGDGAQATPRACVALAVVVSALVVRHHWPLATLGILLVAALSVDFKPIVMLPVLLGLFTVVEYTDRARMIPAIALSTAVILATPWVHGQDVAAPAIISRLVAIGLAVAAGLWLRARADFIIGLRERAARVERERELLASQAVSEERVRIARALHDVVAHNVSLMVVQAQALAATGALTDDAERQVALGRVAGLGREALSEMHRMLGVLRLDPSEAAEREPQPGLGDIETLVARARETGLEAELHCEGDPREVPPGVELSAYRIVQEALTNVIRHARATHVAVTLTHTTAGLDVVVTDDGVGAPHPAAHEAGGGHGLVGMRERVALFGGELRTGAVPNGRGFRVHARLPF